VAVLMVLFWLVQRHTGDAGIVDVVWAAGVGLLAVLFSALADGAPQRRLLIGVLAFTWSARLALYLLRRVLRLPEDGRYQKLRQEWGDDTQWKLFWFFQVQAVWSVLFAAPMLVAASNPQPFGILDVLGAAVWVVAVSGEWIADRQLARFRTNPANRGRVCRDGLWRYSRHPNYFFEWVHWWAYVLIGWTGPYGWLTLMGPALMLFFLFKITGIPPTEANALASRGDAYREYQRTTSVFFPWPPEETTP
jgi:steroid 5-alpha reductase family enzyme